MTFCVGSSVAERAAYRPHGAGSIPSPTLHSLRVYPCSLADVRGFIEREHYSKSVNGITVDQCFTVESNGQVGAAIFGRPAMPGVLNKYSVGGIFRLTELRRFVLVDECPRNSESKVLAVMLRQLKRDGFNRVLSYADPTYGHQGTIYKAAGFSLIGKSSDRMDILWKGKCYPRRNLMQVTRPFHAELRQALATGTATRVRSPGKLCYLKSLDRASASRGESRG